jgi:Family of unknown function (DUF5519)
VSRAAALVDEVANELDSWPGVQIDRRSDGSLLVSYEGLELGILDRDRGVAELRLSNPERDDVVEHGGGAPAVPVYHDENVSHDVHGPSDITAVLELFDRRYRDVRGEDDPYSSRDPE